MPCPCENTNNIVVEGVITEIVTNENYVTFQGNLSDYSLYVYDKNIIRIEKIGEGEYLIVWCENI